MLDCYWSYCRQLGLEVLIPLLHLIRQPSANMPVSFRTGDRIQS